MPHLTTAGPEPEHPQETSHVLTSPLPLADPGPAAAGRAPHRLLGPGSLQGRPATGPASWPSARLGRAVAYVLLAVATTTSRATTAWMKVRPDSNGEFGRQTLHNYYKFIETARRTGRYIDVGVSLRADAADGRHADDGHLHRHPDRDLFAVGYMHGDPGYPRFFAAVGAVRLLDDMLVLADNFLLLYACWEGVGLCSYLLIGFWFAKPSAAAAARKAFLVTRIGDIGLFLGILLLWIDFGHRSTTTRSSSRSTSSVDGTAVARPADRRRACCCSAARSASRRSSRCTSGCPTRWKARRRSAP